MVPREGESVELPEAAADELRANVQENAGVRGSDRKLDRTDERVLGPVRNCWHGWKKHGEENTCRGCEDRQRH